MMDFEKRRNRQGLVLLCLAFVAMLTVAIGMDTHHHDDPDVTVMSITTTSTPPSTSTTEAPAVTTTTVPIVAPKLRDIWMQMASCETGGTMDLFAYNKAGPYYSYFQFGLEDWRSAGGGPGLPWDYPYEEQLVVAKRWSEIRGDGLGAWPACSRKLGLR